jgi:H/ACA ribonucleoprotein complex non-core subunit NAF1
VLYHSFCSILNISFVRRGESTIPYSRGPTPAQMRDYQLAGPTATVDSDSFYGSNPYDAVGVYDADVSSTSGMSIGRMAVTYDDPYGDPYAESSVHPIPDDEEDVLSSSPSDLSSAQPVAPVLSRGRGHGRGRGRGNLSDLAMDRQRRIDIEQTTRGGRGRGRGRGNGQRGRGRGRATQAGPNVTHSAQSNADPDQYEPYAPDLGSMPPPRALSPTSMAIARATGQYADGSMFQQSTNFWPSQAQMAMSPGHIQPHINPRFAAQWGMQIPPTWMSEYGQGEWGQWSGQFHQGQGGGNSYNG